MTSISDLQSYEQHNVLRQSFRPRFGLVVAPRRILHPRFEIVSCVPQTTPANESGTRSTALVARRKRQQGDVAGLLDCACQAALVGGAYASQTTGHNFAALGHKSLQQTNIPVGDGVDLLSAELADLFAAKEFASAFAASGSSGTRSGTSIATWSAVLSILSAGCGSGCCYI
jgi:hypothetical protein